jgi:spectinomycin phosphotransferase
VREPPPDLGDHAVLTALREHWEPSLVRVEHLPVGFGAHHWAAYDEHEPRFFVTYDRLEPRHSAQSLEAAYAGAAALQDRGLEFVLAPLRASERTMTVPLGHGAVSCTPWREGSAGGPLDLEWTTTTLTRLHGAEPPTGVPRWRPLVGEGFGDATAELTATAWGRGPHASTAREAVRRHLTDVERWTRRYHHLADAARARAWVATHGEPHSRNQIATHGGRVLVDWESLKLAPAELDLRTLVEAGAEVDADPEMLELFDLEWRLDEISQYAAWFAAPHGGTADDEIALGGLLHELARP